MMKKRILSAALCIALMLALAGQAVAAENPGITVNGVALQMDAAPRVINQTTYVSYWPIVQALYPTATATWENDRAVVRAPGLELTIQPGTLYLQCNGRYLYVAPGIVIENQVLMVPVRTLAQALGATVSWDGATGGISILAGTGPITPGEVAYQADVVYWLSHIISAESGNQSLSGKIAVGNVILNRVASPRFPNTVYEVIFQRNQFTPAGTGSIHREPNGESVIAAKLCLDGANTAGDSLYFVNPHCSPNSWASRHRPFVATIGAHAFFA